MTTSRREFLKSAGALVVYFTLPGCNSASDQVGNPLPPDGALAVGNWIRIDATGAVHLSLGKVELGQGISTALAQIAA